MINKIFGPDLSYLSDSWFLAYTDLWFALALLLGHNSRKLRALPLYLVFSVTMPLFLLSVGLVAMEFVKWKAHLFEVLVYTACYGICVFILICEWLMRGGANRLTEKRGENWIKEIDYVYISLALLGVVFFLARSQSFAGGFREGTC